MEDPGVALEHDGHERADREVGEGPPVRGDPADVLVGHRRPAVR
jgi:hypothetical protein